MEEQIKRDKSISNDIKEFLELKYRKVNEHVNKKWKYKKQDKHKMEANEEQPLGGNFYFCFNLDLDFEDDDEVGDEFKKEEREKKKRLANIAKRHITDYTKNYDQDFTEVLGLPEITADDLFKKNREKEPIFIDALRQQARFIKIEEGYPHFFNQNEVLNFYDGLVCITKIYSMIKTVYNEMIDIHKPENGQAYSALHEAVIYYSKAKLRMTRSESYDKSSVTEEEETLMNIEVGFICDFPDKMLLLAKELKSFSANEKVEDIDPFIVGH